MNASVRKEDKIKTSSVEPFRRLVKLVGRAFYAEDVLKPKESPGAEETQEENKKKRKKPAAKTETRGIAVVVLDALTRQNWIKEDELAKRLHLNPKQLRKTIKMLEGEMLVMRDHKKENTGQADRGGGTKTVISSYCALDYPQVFDVVRYRLVRAKKKLRDKLESKKEVMALLCLRAGCGAKFSTLEMDRLLDPVDYIAKCERCGSELLSEMDKEAQEAVGALPGGEGGEDLARRRHKEQLNDLLSRFEKQLRPVHEQLLRVKDLPPPYFGSLADWESKASAAQRAVASGTALPASLLNPKMPGNRLGHNAMMPLVGETKLEVSLGGEGGASEQQVAEDAAAQKVLPKWAIREGMNLTAAQLGESGHASVDAQPDGATDTGAGDGEGDRPANGAPMTEEEAEKKRLQEYYEAYYRALYEQQQNQEQQQPDAAGGGGADGAAAGAQGLGAVSEGGAKEGGEDIEWEDEGRGAAGAGNAGEEEVEEWEEAGYEEDAGEGEGGANGAPPEHEMEAEWEDSQPGNNQSAAKSPKEEGDDDGVEWDE